MRITTRRGVGLATSVNPAASNMLRVPTWSSPQVMSRPASVSIGYPSRARAPRRRANSAAARTSA